MAQQKTDFPSQFVRMSKEIRTLQISLAVLAAGVAKQFSPTLDDAIKFVRTLADLENVLLRDDQDIQGYDLVIRAMRSWNVGQS